MGSESTTQRRRPRRLAAENGYDGSLSSGDDEKDNNRQRFRRRRRRTVDLTETRSSENSFPFLFLRVAIVVALLMLMVGTAYRWLFPATETPELLDDDYDSKNFQISSDSAKHKTKSLVRDTNHPQLEFPNMEDSAHETLQERIPPLPVWKLAEYSLKYDAYALAETYESSPSSFDGEDLTTVTNKQNFMFWQVAAGLRKRFSALYGGENAARAMLERGTTVFGRVNENNALPDDLHLTACRILQAKQEQRSFKFSFGGYSVTAGRGNLFQQSFPFVMEQQLHTPFRLLGVELSVRNAAIGGCASFPYGFCMSNFWGEAPDVVSWDYSMNEAGGDPVGLEAYLRHAITQLPSQPKLIVKDTHMAVDRRNILRYYYNNSDALTARDPIVIHTDPAARPFLDRAEAHRPAGFQEWRKFGAPPDAPGQSLHHPAVKEHELIAWLLTMHFLSALEIIAAAESMADADSFLVRRCKVYEPSLLSRHILLPVPKSNRALNSSDQWTSIMFGEPSTGQTSRWTMNSVKCRTSFDPIIEGNLSDIVISGSAGEDLEMMLPKSKMFYNRGWVLDLSDEEKKAKRNLNRFGGLGFVDNKKAYYGISASGLIRLLLPFDAGKREGSGLPSVGDRAKNWFISVVMCEVNEKRSANACNTEKDVHYMVGGVNATSVKIMDVEGTLYLGKKLCIHIVVPDKAVLTSRAEIGLNRVPSIPTKILENQENLHQVGLLITAAIHNNHINRRDEACSISHVIWEQQKFEAATST